MTGRIHRAQPEIIVTINSSAAKTDNTDKNVS
jgi:hypothetical protein